MFRKLFGKLLGNLFGKKIKEQVAKPMKVAFYMRTSSGECAQENIDEQYAAIKRFIAD